MAFCTGCGADVTGKNFCMTCGKPVGSGQPASGPPQGPAQAAASASAGPSGYAPPQQVYGAPPPMGPPMQTGPKKTSPVVWIIVGVLGFFLLVGVVISIGVGMFVHKVKQNPAMAVAKLLTAANPDIEVLDASEGRNSIKIRDKKTGETMEVNLDDIKAGRINLKGPKGERASIQANADGQNGSVEIKGPDGTASFNSGANAKIPDWVPAYPGATATANFSVQGGDGSGGTFSYTTKDPPDAVLAFYTKSLTGAGFKITSNVAGTANGASGNMISAENEASKQTVVITLGGENGSTAVNVIYGTKK
jgi:hypothetical protein